MEYAGSHISKHLIFSIPGALIQFGSQSEEKMALWRAYELMESQAGNFKAAQNVYQRSIRDVIVRDDDPDIEKQSLVSVHYHITQPKTKIHLQN
jgi:hypothetical protein